MSACRVKRGKKKGDGSVLNGMKKEECRVLALSEKKGRMAASIRFEDQREGVRRGKRGKEEFLNGVQGKELPAICGGPSG